MSPLENHCLELCQKGLMKLSSIHQVMYYHKGRKHWYAKKVHQLGKTGRSKYSFGKPHRGNVYANRLVFILYNQRTIPDGYVVDHWDEDRRNDHPDNLRLMLLEDSHEQGQDIALNRICSWFGFIAKYGRPPATDIELQWVSDGFY